MRLHIVSSLEGAIKAASRRREENPRSSVGPSPARVGQPLGTEPSRRRRAACPKSSTHANGMRLMCDKNGRRVGTLRLSSSFQFVRCELVSADKHYMGAFACMLVHVGAPDFVGQEEGSTTEATLRYNCRFSPPSCSSSDLQKCFLFTSLQAESFERTTFRRQ